MASIQAAISNHFKVFFRDMTDQPFDEVDGRNRFFYVFIIFMTIVMESNGLSVIVVNPGGGDDWTAEITPNIFNNRGRITKARFSIDIKAMFMFCVTLGLGLFERGANDGFHFIEECSTKSVT